jgi:predicted GIY-YIG superfamily endonuclease
MPWAYIIRGTTGRHYIGSTTDLARRGTDATFAEPTGNPARAGFPLQL